MQKLYFTETDKKMLSKLEQEFRIVFKSGDALLRKQQADSCQRQEPKIAIKLHMGEVYNPNHLQPDFVRKVAKLMASMNLKPFLFDSPTMYGGARHTAEGYIKQAAGMGFTEENIGCPVVVSDDYVESKGKHLTYQVCKPLVEADGVLVLTHFKGHACTGIGGAVKNLGMGALTSKSKADIHHGAMPVLKGKCALCKKCLEVCPTGCIKYDEHGPCFNYKNCYGCSKCIQNCPNKCLKPRLAEFDDLLADGANAALKKFKNVYFVSVLRRITNVCDCSSKDLHIVCPDIGILMGRDACAIDSASVDLVNRRSGRDLFLELWRKPPLMHVSAAEKLGMGTQDFEIEDV